MGEIKSQEILNNIAEHISEKNIEMLKQVAMTAMTGKGAESSKEKLSEIAVDAVKSIIEKENDKVLIDKECIKLEKKVGGSVGESELIKGIILDKERVHSGMPNYVKNAKIALIDSAIEIKNTEIDAKIQITEPSQMQDFIEQEEKMLRDKVEKIARSKANVIICQKGIDDIAQHFLAKKRIYAVRRAKQSDMEALARATGAKIVSNLDDLSADDLGEAGIVEEIKIGDEEMTYVKECKNPKSVTILIKGGTEHVVDEVKRAMEDAIGDIIASLQNGKVVAGAGAPEIELAFQLRQYADSLSGREQLAVKAFADSVEIIPRTLAENAGIDPIDILTELRVAHSRGEKWAGIDVFKGCVVDSWKANVIEPLKIKTQAISSAAEVAVMMLRIDDVIAGSGSNKEPPLGKMPPGMEM